MVDYEELDRKLPDFMSFDLSYAMVIKLKRGGFKFQLGYHYVEKRLEHRYYFNYREGLNQRFSSNTTNYFYTYKTKLHPMSSVINFSLGYTFYFGGKSKSESVQN